MSSLLIKDKILEVYRQMLNRRESIPLPKSLLEDANVDYTKYEYWKGYYWLDRADLDEEYEHIES